MPLHLADNEQPSATMSSSDTRPMNAKLFYVAAAVSVLAWKVWSYTAKQRRPKPAEPKKPVAKDKISSTAPSKVSEKKFDLASLLRREEITFGKF